MVSYPERVTKIFKEGGEYMIPVEYAERLVKDGNAEHIDLEIPPPPRRQRGRTTTTRSTARAEAEEKETQGAEADTGSPD